MNIRQAEKIVRADQTGWREGCPWKLGTRRRAIRKVYWTMRRRGLPWGWATIAADEAARRRDGNHGSNENDGSPIVPIPPLTPIVPTDRCPPLTAH